MRSKPAPAAAPEPAVRKPRPAPRLTVAPAPPRVESPPVAPAAVNPALDYAVDLAQRATLFFDILRERADNLLAHEAAGLPPLLHFEAEMVLDARTFEEPANYALMRITKCGTDHLERYVRADARPVIVIDPRAGHGPGIGGFKRDSEVGVALRLGHPVYFVVFFPDPCAGQTLADVLHALRRFVEEVTRRHPGKPPALYGNCQAGWAIAILSAHCAELAGPAVLNGSPLSYWAGATDVNPMRLAGGLLGGAWLTHFAADIGDGRFDGAWLVQNFEALNPGNALWGKLDRVFADPSGERERYLEFERWWSGYYFFSREEITAIVENLFVGNRLESGELDMGHGTAVDLRNIRNPLVLFASHGDNIAPPHQALNWIAQVYGSTAALEAAGQRIVYLTNPHVGHLGIFVSASVALREHRAILGALDAVEALAPGLYEMLIEEGATEPRVRFERRRVEDVCFRYGRAQFERVREMSEVNTQLYLRFASPWVRAFAAPWSAALLKWFHPMRASRWLFSARFNPWIAGLAPWARLAAAQRRPVGAENPFYAQERETSRRIADAFEQWRVARDALQEAAFEFLFGTGAPPPRSNG